MFEFIVSLIERGGYLGIAFLMFIENVFPPIPSELVMPLAGFVASRGQLGLAGVVLAGSAGSLAGAVFWYWIGRSIGASRLTRWASRHGRWLTLSPHEVEASSAWFRRRGPVAVLLGRLVPAVRTLISVPAGVASMPLSTFLLFSTVGTIAWTAALAGAGYVLGGRYDAIAAWLDPVSTGIVALLLGSYLYRVATFGRRHRARQESTDLRER